MTDRMCMYIYIKVEHNYIYESNELSLAIFKYGRIAFEGSVFYLMH